jgi:hypothetical protein
MAESKLVSITEAINKAVSLQEAKQIFKDYVVTSDLPEDTRNKIISQLEPLKSLAKLQKYFYNSLLAYEGHGLR